jgi:FAD:protein FMN transferase
VSESYLRSAALMGTVVTVQVVGHGESLADQQEREAGVTRALDWFHAAEARCTRFEPGSEVNLLCARVGDPVPVSDLLFEAIRFALAVAEETGGAFDPTVGALMEARGFNREYRSGAAVQVRTDMGTEATYRDVTIDEERRTVTLRTPLVIDLGAVVKGLAIDLAARELEPFQDFAIDAGGDLYLGGCNAAGESWSVGIRNPREREHVLATLRVRDAAVCTSGDYERPVPGDSVDHHILDARAGTSAIAIASATVIAPSAMVADALSTAAFVLGPVEGLALLERHGLEGLLVTPALEQFTTPGWLHA